MPESVGFNPFSPAFQADPYPIYHRLRAESPIHRIQSFNVDQWYLTRYADVQTVLNDARLISDDLPDRLQTKASHLKQGDFNALIHTTRHWLFFLEPPDHTRLRTLVSRSFAATKIEQLRPSIQIMVDRLLDRCSTQSSMDVMADLATPLPALVSAALLGMPLPTPTQLTQWASGLFRVFDQPLGLQDYQSINQVALEFRDYLQDVVNTFRKRPEDNLISHLIALNDSNRLSEAELLALIGMLFSVGQETTENLIGNSVFALLTHPHQLDKLKRQPTLVAAAIDELLRYDSPVQIIIRRAIADVELEGNVIHQGDKVNLLLGAANRDPARFVAPDQLDITRQESSKLPFGSGMHYCLGSELARVQGQIAVNTLIHRFDLLTLERDRIERRKNIVLRGLKVLPITFTIH